MNTEASSNENVFGTLQLEHFGIVETLLSGRGIMAPILTTAHLTPDNQGHVAMYSEYVISCIDQCKSIFMPTANISFCFVGTSMCNAFAHRSLAAPGHYFVVLLGGVLGIQRILDEILENKEVRRYLGVQTDRPVDAHDPELSFLVAIAIRWLVFHELGHIKNGHLHLSRETAFGSHSAEAMQEGGNLERNVTLHTLEMDADAFACSQTINFLNSPASKVSSLTGLERKIRAFYVAMYAVMRSFDHKNWSIQQLYRFTHPCGFLRHSLLGSWGYSAAEQTSSLLNPERWVNIATEAVHCTEKALGNCGVPQLPEDLPAFYPDEFASYNERLLGRWAKIREELEPHLLGGKLADAQLPPR